MFRRFWRDVILGTIFIMALMAFVATVVSEAKVFDIFDPIGDAFGDMEFTDIYFSQLLDDPIADERVVLVNTALESRASIAMMIDSISQHGPAVMGVDIFFDFPKEDTLSDMMLAEALGRVENLVMVSKLLYNEEADGFDSLHTSWPWFTYNADSAFANLITDAEVQQDLKMCRTFNPTLTDVNGKVHNAFAVQMASYYDKEKADNFVERGNEEEVINYRGNVLDYGATKFGNKYYEDYLAKKISLYVPNFFELEKNLTFKI